MKWLNPGTFYLLLDLRLFFTPVKNALDELKSAAIVMRQKKYVNWNNDGQVIAQVNGSGIGLPVFISRDGSTKNFVRK